jgi:hypothetical protein
MVSRAKALPVPTRVFFAVGGTAQRPVTTPPATVDYLLNGMTVPDPSKPQLANQRTFGKPYVDIPAGRTSTIVSLTPIDDARFEAAETATFTIDPQPAYRVSNPSSATLSIYENDFRINFQPAGVATPPGYVADTGLAYGARGPGAAYGWETDISGKAVVRKNPESPDARYDSFVQMQAGGNHKWEIALPNGTYMVRVVAGDADSTNATYGIGVEDQLALFDRPRNVLRFSRMTGVLQVTDGRLTVKNFLGSFNNKIDFIEVKSVPRRSRLGQIALVSAPLKTPETAGYWHEQPNGLFSDDRIDEPLWN